MKKLSRRETLILAVTLGLMAFFIIFQLVIKPLHEGALDINDQLRTDRELLFKARQMKAQKPSVEARYQYLTDLVGESGSEDAQMPAIVSKIETTARESNVHIANIQPHPSTTQKEAEFLGVEVELDGQWLDIVKFLYLLQQQPNFYFINELSLEKYSDNTNSLTAVSSSPACV